MLFIRSVHKTFVEKLKIVVKNFEKLNCSYDKVSHDLQESNIPIPLSLKVMRSIRKKMIDVLAYVLDDNILMKFLSEKIFVDVQIKCEPPN